MSKTYLVKSFNNDSSLEMKIVAIEKAQEQTLKLEFTFKSYELNGIFSSWINYNDLIVFYNKLIEIEKTRSGVQSILGESPDTFSLTIENYDSLGHFIISIKLGRYESIPKRQYIGLSGSIDIGSEYLLDFIQTCSLLIHEYQHTHNLYE